MVSPDKTPQEQNEHDIRAATSMPESPSMHEWKDPLGLSLPGRARFEAEGGRRNGFPMVASVLDACADALEAAVVEWELLRKELEQIAGDDQVG